jgi:membrane-associated protease RseP (regulator of RpoE activity)
MRARGWLGVVLSDEGDGVVISSVLRGSPAQDSGLKEGDRIVEIAGEEIESAEDVRRAIGSRKPGDSVGIRVERDGKEKGFDVTLAERDREVRIFRERRGPGVHEFEGWEGHPPMHFGMLGSRNYLGVHVLGMTEDLRIYFKAPRGRGVLVSKVTEDAPAARAGIRAGDVIVEVDGRSIEHPGEIREALAEREPGDRVPVKVIRDGSERTFDLEVAERPARKDRRGALWVDPDGETFELEVLPENFEEDLHRTIEKALESVEKTEFDSGRIEGQIREAMETASRVDHERIAQQVEEALRQSELAALHLEGLGERIQEAMDRAREELERSLREPDEPEGPEI